MEVIKNKMFVNIKRSGTINSIFMHFPTLPTSHETVITVFLSKDIDKIH